MSKPSHVLIAGKKKGHHDTIRQSCLKTNESWLKSNLLSLCHSSSFHITLLWHIYNPLSYKFHMFS
jgi:hypothetical protein